MLQFRGAALLKKKKKKKKGWGLGQWEMLLEKASKMCSRARGGMSQKSDFSLLLWIHLPIRINVLKITLARYFEATGAEKGELLATC